MLTIFFQATTQDEIIPITTWYRGFFLEKRNEDTRQAFEMNANKRLEAIETQDDSAQVFLFLDDGLIYLTQKYNYDSALYAFLKGLEHAEKSSFVTGRVFSYLAIAKVFGETGSEAKSLELLERARSMASSKAEILIFVLSELGKVNASLDSINDAEENYQEVLTYAEQLRKPELKAEALFNLGNVLLKKQELEAALELLKEALAIHRKLGNRIEEGALLNNIGHAYYLTKNEERAYANFKAALEIFQSVEYKFGMADAYNNIGEWYYNQNKLTQALANFELAQVAGRASKRNEPVAKALDYLSLVHKASGNYKNALEYREQYIALMDFMSLEKGAKHMIEIESKSVIDATELKVQQLEIERIKKESELAEQKQKQKFLYAVLSLVAVVVVLVFYMYLMKRRSNKELKAINQTVETQNIQLQNLNATKDKFFSIIGHDLKGPLNSLTSFSNLLINYFDSLSKDEIQNLAKDLDKSLKNLYTLLNNLLEWARSQTGNIDFTKEKFDIVEVLQQNRDLLATQASIKELTILYEANKPIFISAHKQSITTVIRNLISNAIKFTPNGGVIKLEAIQNKDEVVVSVADTGVGMSNVVIEKLFKLDAKHSTLGTANEKGTGLGLILCKDFIEKNGGRVWVESEVGKGSIFYFSVCV